MPKSTPTDAQYAYGKKIIDEVLEPELAKMVEIINKKLKSSGIMLTGNVDWLIYGTEEETKK